ncbi:MAG: alanine--tRNA ligase [Candidatus Aenigmarchaeota archaeon]|nr:alanine--tRNA ligase [Candidatus Aenigmarchaeota archaeon]
MLDDKALKKKYFIEFAKEPSKYYPNGMADLGFVRRKCMSCGRAFWSVKARSACGDSACCGGYSFIGNSPAKHKMTYPEVWKKFSELLQKQGYTPIKRYPVTARWRTDLHFVEASIDDFIPYVISGEVKPPANPLVIPQTCLRFNDIDNVGITGAHYTCFVMIGQHRFEQPKDYRMNDYFLHLMKWFTDGLGLPKEEIILHEDVWAGSGNFGPCVEFFSGGLELANQVYMQFRQTETGYEDLKLKVLDMGLGQERNAWFSHGTVNSYETTFPTVMTHLKSITGIQVNEDIIKKFLPYASMLNIDETEDMDKAWKKVAEKTGYDAKLLRENVMPLAALYSIAEHTRTLLVAINDGTLPSNVGGGYNLRLILRRAFSLSRKYGWDIDFAKLCELHADYLKEIYPELQEAIGSIDDILAYEKEKYDSTKEKSREIVSKLRNVDTNKLIELYDSHGIPPEDVKEVMPNIVIPENFYLLVADRHRRTEKKEKMKIEFDAAPTELLYYKDNNAREFTATVLKIRDNWVVLDRTVFYPEGGGQQNDLGAINAIPVEDVQKFGTVVAHKMSGIPFKEGDTVKGVIDAKRRERLMHHHSAVHIVNGLARRVLGSHLWQAGALKTPEKATIDLTHYKIPSHEQLDEIEKMANDAVKRNIQTHKHVIERTEAEKRFGMRIYQGPAIPAKELRIVEIPEVDTEACGGTHVDNTGTIRRIIITKAEKIQDGVVRLTLVAGEAAKEYEEKMASLAREAESILETKDIVAGTEQLFNEWKRARKEYEEKAASLAQSIEVKSVDVLDAERKSLMAITRTGGSYVLFGTKDKSIVASGGNASEIMKFALNLTGGNGGGSGTFAQGTYENTPDELALEKIRKRMKDG